MTQTDDLERRLWAIESGRDPALGFTCWYRNPDGPEAAVEIARLRAALGEAFETLTYIHAASECEQSQRAAKEAADSIDAALKGSSHE